MELGGFCDKFEWVLLKNDGKFMNKNIKNQARLNLIKNRLNLRQIWRKSSPNFSRPFGKRRGLRSHFERRSPICFLSAYFATPGAISR